MRGVSSSMLNGNAIFSADLRYPKFVLHSFPNYAFFLVRLSKDEGCNILSSASL
jgi:hypothetical protein